MAVEILLSHDKTYFQVLLEKRVSKEEIVKFEQTFDSAIAKQTTSDDQLDDMPLKSALARLDLTLDLSLPSRNEYQLFISNVLNTGITYGAVAGCKALFFLGKSRLTGQCDIISLSDVPVIVND